MVKLRELILRLIVKSKGHTRLRVRQGLGLD